MKIIFKHFLSCQEKYSVNEQAHLDKFVNRNFAKRARFWPFSLYALRPILYSVHQFGGYFEVPSGVKIVPKCACWKT